jgi:hypothetical protein
MSADSNLCIHMAVHQKIPGQTCESQQPIEVSKIEVQEASEVDGIVVVKLIAYFHAEDAI